MASHDLQEPLRKVHTFAEGLKTKAVALGKRERDYRERMGWEPESGRPRPETLEKLGLSELVGTF